MATTKATQTTLKMETEKKPVVKEEVKTEVKAEAKVEAKAEPAKKAPAKKTAAKKTTTKKAPAKKAPAKKAAAKKTDVKADIFVQFQGMETSEAEIMDKVQAAWEAEGKKVSAIKRVKLYFKPEDYKAYYVINDGLKNCSTGAVDL